MCNAQILLTALRRIAAIQAEYELARLAQQLTPELEYEYQESKKNAMAIRAVLAPIAEELK
jgi:ribosome-binding factor A